MIRTLAISTVLVAIASVASTGRAQEGLSLALADTHMPLELSVPGDALPPAALTPATEPAPVIVGTIPAELGPLEQWQRQFQQDANNFAQQEHNSFDQMFDSLDQVFDAQDIPGPLGTLSTVHIFPGNSQTIGQVLPYLSLSQDADEVDANLRLGAGGGAIFRFDSQTDLNLEAVYLQGTGDVNPQTSNEGRFIFVLTHKF